MSQIARECGNFRQSTLVQVRKRAVRLRSFRNFESSGQYSIPKFRQSGGADAQLAGLKLMLLNVLHMLDAADRHCSSVSWRHAHAGPLQRGPERKRHSRALTRRLGPPLRVFGIDPHIFIRDLERRFDQGLKPSGLWKFAVKSSGCQPACRQLESTQIPKENENAFRYFFCSETRGSTPCLISW